MCIVRTISNGACVCVHFVFCSFVFGSVHVHAWTNRHRQRYGIHRIPLISIVWSLFLVWLALTLCRQFSVPLESLSYVRENCLILLILATSLALIHGHILICSLSVFAVLLSLFLLSFSVSTYACALHAQAHTWNRSLSLSSNCFLLLFGIVCFRSCWCSFIHWIQTGSLTEAVW